MNKLVEFDKLIQLLEKSNKSKILVHGIFDILHKGHIILFSEAKKIGDILIVGIDSDNNARMLKGGNRPFNNLNDRVCVLNRIIDVDYIFIIPDFPVDGDTYKFYIEIYRKLIPDFIATSIEAGIHGQYKKKQAEECGIKFVNIPEVHHPRPSDLL